MVNELEYSWRHSNIPAELASVRPIGDCVLVRVIPEPEIAGLIVMPTGARERGYQAPRMGEVIACGDGDKAPPFYAECECGADIWAWGAAGKCPCGAKANNLQRIFDDRRHPMHVKPGDRILYWRCQANEVVINEETYQFLHEEQHILGVIED